MGTTGIAKVEGFPKQPKNESSVLAGRLLGTFFHSVSTLITENLDCCFFYRTVKSSIQTSSSYYSW